MQNGSPWMRLRPFYRKISSEVHQFIKQTSGGQCCIAVEERSSEISTRSFQDHCATTRPIPNAKRISTDASASFYRKISSAVHQSIEWTNGGQCRIASGTLFWLLLSNRHLRNGSSKSYISKYSSFDLNILFLSIVSSDGKQLLTETNRRHDESTTCRLSSFWDNLENGIANGLTVSQGLLTWQWFIPLDKYFVVDIAARARGQVHFHEML
jgi:hypothetical protein